MRSDSSPDENVDVQGFSNAIAAWSTDPWTFRQVSNSFLLSSGNISDNVSTAYSVADALMAPPSIEEIDVDSTFSPSLPKIIALVSFTVHANNGGERYFNRGGVLWGRGGTHY